MSFKNLSVLIVTVAILNIMGCSPMQRMVKREVDTLFSETSVIDNQTIGENDIADVPPLVQKYLRYSGVIGKERVHTVRLKQQGKFKRKPGTDWLPLAAKQYYNCDSIGFVWVGKIKMNPLMPVTGRDKYLNGEGNMLIKLWSLIKVADAKGPEVNQSEILRYLSEMPWFPASFLSPAIHWKTIDDHTVHATLSAYGQSVSGDFSFNETGQITQFSTERYYENDGQYTLRKWGGRYDQYKEMNGWIIPTHAVVTWTFPEGDYSYFDGTITEIDYNVSERY